MNGSNEASTPMLTTEQILAMGEAELAKLPVEQLEAALVGLAGGGMTPEGGQPAQGIDQPPAAPAMPPGLIEAATARLAEM